MLKTTIVTTGLYAGSGGPVKTINAFKQALDAPLYCFGQDRPEQEQGFAIAGAREVRTSDMPILRSFCYAPPAATRQAEDAVRNSGLISCHLFYRYHNLWINRVCRKHKVPYWFVPHGVLDPWVMESKAAVKKLFLKLGGERFLQEAATLIFATKTEQEKAASMFDIPQGEVIPWPVDPIDLSRKRERRQAIRKQMGITEEARVLLFFGRVHPMKRPLETIEIFAKAAKGKDAHLLIVGNPDGVSEQDCLALAARQGCQNSVHFIGPVYGDAKWDYLFASDAYISLSHRENFNHTAAESMAAALPVILSRGNDLCKEVAGINCGWTLDNDTPELFEQTIRAYLETDTELMTTMGKHGRSWVENNLSYAKFRERLQHVADRYSLC